DLVTGVQTCALPIYRQPGDGAVDNVADRGAGHRSTSEKSASSAAGAICSTAPSRSGAGTALNWSVTSRHRLGASTARSGAPTGRSEERRGGKEGGSR